MKFGISGITIALVVSMAAFVLSFHACNSLRGVKSDSLLYKTAPHSVEVTSR